MPLPRTITHFKDLTLPVSITTLLLDLDNTCYCYEPCHQAGLVAARSLLENLRSEPLTDFLIRYKAAQMRVKSRIPHQAASHSRVLYFQALLEDLRDPNLYERCVALEHAYWSAFYAGMVPTEGLLEFLAQCRQHGTTVAVVSDLTTAIQCEKLTTLGLAPYVNVLVTSEEAGAEKPDPRCFLLALEKTGAQANETVMIGDSYDRDIQGATVLGMAAIQFIHADSSHSLPLR